MKRAFALALLCVLWLASPHSARAQTAEVISACNGVTLPVGQPWRLFQNPNGSLCINATVTATASITGFRPTAHGTPIVATTGGVSGTLPSGSEVVATNVGATNGAYCALGATATTADQYIAPNGGWFAFAISGDTQLTCITSTSTTTINTAGGTGLPTGTGGGGGGGGGSGGAVTNAGTFVTQDNGTNSTAEAAALGAPGDTAWSGSGSSTIVAALKAAYAKLAAIATSVSGTLTVAGTVQPGNTPNTTPWLASVSQGGNTQVVKAASTAPAATDPAAVVSISPNSLTPTGSAVPAAGNYLANNVGGNLTGQIGCGSSVVYDASTNGATQLVALSAGKAIYVCGYSILAAGTVNVELDYGTGTACATGNNKMTPAYQLTAQVGIVDGSPIYRGLSTAASNELCLKTSAGVAVQAVVYYTQL